MRKRHMAVAGLLATAVLTMVGAGPVSAAPAGLTAGNFQLRKGAYNSTIASLDAVLPKVDTQTILNNTNRTTTACGAHAQALITSFCWDTSPDDEGTYDWYPQGITTSGDAYPSGGYTGKPAILVSWYWNGASPQRGTRLAFIDYSNPSAPTYRVVLLVRPYVDSGGHPNFKAETTTDSAGAVDSLHAGGIAWYGHYVYVVDTWGGFRVFDLNHLWDVHSTDGDAIGRQSDGTYEAYGYTYVLPEAFRYTASTANGYPALRYSSVSLDRTGTSDSMVVSEYNTGATDTHRVVRFPADPSMWELGPASTDGLVHATEAYETGITHMQGIASIRGRFFASTSYTTSSASYGSLYTFTRGESATGFLNVLQAHPEDVSYWPATDALWSLSETPGNRVVYAMRASLLGWPTVQQGDTGDRVKTVQYLLNHLQNAGLAVDGDFGSVTAAAVKTFQSAHGLAADGIVHATTWVDLMMALSPGATGDAVRAVQNELTAHGFAAPVTGTFDQTTSDNLVAFQNANGLQASGTVDADTWRTLVL
jgi:hypothetical protein